MMEAVVRCPFFELENGQIVVVITGWRGKKSNLITSSFDRLSSRDVKRIEKAMKRLVRDPKVGEIVFGGARGSDTVALYYARKHRVGEYPKLLVIVPSRIVDQPKETQEITRKCADACVEMGQMLHDEDGKFQYIVYKMRNIRMLDETQTADGSRVVAFWNGQRTRSGTWSTISMARRYYSLPVDIVWLGKGKSQKKLG